MSPTQRVVKRARALDVNVLTRTQWGTRHEDVYRQRRKTRPHNKPLSKTDTLWQHITVTHATDDFRDDCRVVERIGMERFGSGCSYNWLWNMRSGTIAVGQPLDAKGTHTVNNKGIPGYSHDQNLVSYAVAAVGMPGDKPTDHACEQLSRLIAALMLENVLTPGHDYNPHSMVAAKDCPTDAVRQVMPSVHSRALEIYNHRKGK